jgi:hypothetical protein
MLPRRLSARLNLLLNRSPAVAQALRDKPVLDGRCARADEPEWMQGFGKLKRLHKETVRVQSVIDQEFEVIEPEDRR